MKLRILFLSVCAVAIGATGWYVYSGGPSEATSAYIPRSEFKSAQGIKGAVEYTKMIKSNIYTGEIEREDVINTRNAVEAINRQSIAKDDNLSWTSMGPTNVGGRTRGLVVYPNDANKILAGGISGGLFRTTNGGLSWTQLTGFQDAIGVSSIAILGNGSIYVATGHSREGNASGNGGSVFMGAGLFVSTDDGATFNQASDFAPTPWDPDDNWAETNVIMADPSNENRLWIGTNFGLYPYIDGEAELEPLPEGLLNQRVQDFVISSTGKNIMVATGIRTFVSTDFGMSFTQVNGSVYTQDGSGTIDLAVSHGDEDMFYSCVSAPNGRLKGIYATQNAGQTWSLIAPSNTDGNSPFAPFGSNTQGNYDITITAVPTAPDEDFNVIMGGIRLYRWESPPNVTPGITLWEGINDNFSSSPGLPPSPIYVHSDIQNSTWGPDGTLYLGTDGGMFKSENNGATWSSINNNYSTTQYYSIAFSPTGQTLGGLQDNGTLWLSLLGGNAGSASQFTGGDGFACAISQEFPSYMFSTLYYGEVFRSIDGGSNVAQLGDLSSVSSGGGNDFTTDIALHENPHNEYSEIYVEYSPLIDSPYLQLFDDSVVVTASGDTIIGKIPAGTELVVDASNSDFTLSQVLDNDLYFYSYYVRTVGNNEFVYHNIADTAFIQETPQFMMAAALSNGVYITREPMKTNGVPQWFPLSEDNGSPTSVKFSPDGDHLYVGYSSGQLLRFSGLNDAWTADELDFDDSDFVVTKTVLYNGSGAITGIDVDYSEGQGTPGTGPASERVVISIGNYGGNGKIRVSDVAASTTSNTTFENIWNVESSITGMPCYSVVMDVDDSDKILAGTEYGVWYTDNNGDSWVNVNNGDMVRVPVYALSQQKYPEWKAENSGVVYAGTHGRGVFKTDYFLNPWSGVEHAFAETAPLSDLVIYPNPATDMATLRYTMGTSGKVNMYVYSLDGRLVDAEVGQSVEAGKDRTTRLNVADLPNGTYLVQMTTDKESKTVKFVKSN